MCGPVGAPPPACCCWSYPRHAPTTYPRVVPHTTSRRLPALLLAALGGVLTDAAFPDRSLWPLAFVGVALLVLSIRRDSARWAFAMGTVWGLGFFLPHLWWANYAVGAVPWVALALAQSLITGAGLAIWVWVRRGSHVQRLHLMAAVPFALVWVITEQVRQVWPFGGFPWGRLGFSQTDGPLLALASVAGAPLVSAAVVAIGYLLATAVVRLARMDLVRGPGALVAAFALVGASALIPLPTQAEEGTLRIGAVQGNVATPGLDAFAQAREVLDNHVAGTHNLLEGHGEGLDLIVWPENSSDYNPRVDDIARAGVEEVLRAADVPLLMGTDRYTGDARFNEMVLWEPGQGDTFAYAKQIPAAFAEYIPMRDFARLFSPAVDLVRTDMVGGTAPAVVPVPAPALDREVLVGTPICFEVAYDALNREAVLAGAEVLLVPTNNASFGFTAESTQQLAMSRLRAVEHGRATIQISTVGVSGVITPNGVLTRTTELFTPDHFATTVPLRSTLTLADRMGDWPIIVSTVAVVLWFGAGIVTGRSSRRRGAGPATGRPRQGSTPRRGPSEGSRAGAPRRAVAAKGAR